ncbi:MAG: hypothetical protein GXY05_15885 [Clostridiales bacterium]|nr:hypothetical protein [Clostridiales bacterium]
MEKTQEFFESELCKIIKNSSMLKDATIVGRACFVRLSKDIKAKIRFYELSTHEKFDSLKVEIINKNEGIVDHILLRFGDVFGPKPVRNPNFKDGVVPHIWAGTNGYNWYVYALRDADYAILCKNIEDYLSVYIN